MDANFETNGLGSELFQDPEARRPKYGSTILRRQHVLAEHNQDGLGAPIAYL